MHCLAKEKLQAMMSKRDEDEKTVSHPDILTHTSERTYYVADLVKYVMDGDIPKLITRFQLQGATLPVDQDLVRVRWHEGMLK